MIDLLPEQPHYWVLTDEPNKKLLAIEHDDGTVAAVVWQHLEDAKLYSATMDDDEFKGYKPGAVKYKTLMYSIDKGVPVTVFVDDEAKLVRKE